MTEKPKFVSSSNPILSIGKHYGLNDRGTFMLAGMLLEEIQGKVISKTKWTDAKRLAISSIVGEYDTNVISHAELNHIYEMMSVEIKRHRGLL